MRFSTPVPILWDMVDLTKLVAVVSYGLVAGLFFFLGQSLLGFRAGVLAALFFTFFPDQFTYFSGGFSKAWMIPLLLICVFVLETKRWRDLLILMPLAALAYPMATVLIGLTVLIYLCLLCLEGAGHRAEAVTGFRWLVLGSSLALLPLLLKYLDPPASIGPMTSGAELMAMPEMYRGGLSPYLPTPALWEEVLRHLNHPLVLYSALLFFLVLGKRGIGWQKSWTALVLASLLGYVLADYFFMSLYIPNRYTRYSVVVILVLWHAHNWDRLLRIVPLELGARRACRHVDFRWQLSVPRDIYPRQRNQQSDSPSSFESVYQ